jgi:hypothetical protein
MSSTAEKMLHAFNRTILRCIYSPIKDNMGWTIRYNTGIYDVPIARKVTAFIKI